MKCKLSEIFEFLKNNDNHKHNQALQLTFIKSSLTPFSSNKSKIKSLLMDAGNTQRSQSLDLISPFWRAFDEYESEFDSAQDLANFLAWHQKKPGKKIKPSTEPHVSEKIFLHLQDISGFGKKTAALFVKWLVLAHSENHELRFLKDVDNLAGDGLKLYLPVDSVIQHIFSKNFCNLQIRSWNAFWEINEYLFDFMKTKNIPMNSAIYWDDLWYWGFITQRGSGDNRKTKFNEEKYRSLKTSTQEALSDVKVAANKFIQILG